jgi:Mn2+/Fe2+ NRAMP family transporter
MRPVLRRLMTRGLAVIPAVIVAAVMGDKAVGQLLVISQVRPRVAYTGQTEALTTYIHIHAATQLMMGNKAVGQLLVISQVRPHSMQLHWAN